MASWNRVSPRQYGYWAAHTMSTASGYMPQRSPSYPPIQNMAFSDNKYQMSKYQTDGMTGSNYVSEDIFGDLLPSSFPRGTDPKIISCFQKVDRDGNGYIDEREMKVALSSYSSTFSLKTIRLLISTFTKGDTNFIGPKEFADVYSGLQQWKAMFQRFDRDRNAKIDLSELREALRSLGYPVSEAVLELLISKYGGENMAVGFDGFIECCLTVKGLTDKFKGRDQMFRGAATFNYEDFMRTVLPFIVA